MARSPEHRNKRLTTNARDRYKSSHWGHSGKQLWSKDEPFDSPLTVMGALKDLEIDGADVIEFDGRFSPDRVYRGTLLAFSPRQDERLYPIMSRKNKQQCQGLIVDGGEWVTLTEAADRVGGRQCDFTYPRAYVQVVGECTNVIYETEKGEKGNPEGGFAEFTHGLGEKSGLHPLLCVDEDGRLWLAGGNYWVHDDGIVD